MSDDARPEPDRIEGAPHPREAVDLYGQARAEAAFLEAHATGRLHHAWLLCGPRGIGKATLAWRMARFLVAHGVGTGPGGAGAPDAPGLQMRPGDPVFRRSVALSEPRIALCRRGWDEKTKRLRQVLSVDEIRRLKSHFTLSSTDGGWRVAIIDAADDMNTAAANALLKLLEEPPARTVLILVCHQPARLLPTIRSRCRVLRLDPLDEEDLARALDQAGAEIDRIPLLHRLSSGSAGDALRLVARDGAALYPRLVALLGSAPQMDRGEIAALAAPAAGRTGVDTYLALTDLWLLLVARLARAGASGQLGGLLDFEAPLVHSLVPDARAARVLAELHDRLDARITHARAVNLDPELVILDMVTTTEQAVARLRMTRA